MSIKVTQNAEVETDVVEVEVTTSTDSVQTNDQCVDIETQESTVTGQKQEFSIVGDSLYASMNTDEAPTWLTSLVDSIVENQVSQGIFDYNTIQQDVRDAIDALDLASNNYVEQINFAADVDARIATKITELNTNLGNTYATITGLETAVSNADQALAAKAAQIKTDYEGYTDGAVDTINTSLSNAIGTNAASITALTATFDDAVSGLEANANAVQSLQTYVGLTGEGAPNNLGLLADVSLLKKQTDGSVDMYAGEHTVMVDTNPASDLDNELQVDQWPYALWTPMKGSADPVGNTRLAKKGTVEDSYPVEPNTVYTNTTAGTYFLYDTSTSSWNPITQEQYDAYTTFVRTVHQGDTYIQYGVDGDGNKTYEGAYKFVQTVVDGSSPYATDTEGFTWTKVTDNDAQAAYINALNAYALADSKVTVYFALHSVNNPGPGTYQYYFDGTNIKDTSNSSTVTPKLGDQATVKYVDGEAEDIHLLYFDGLDWVDSTAEGLVAKSRWIVDLDAFLGGKSGNQWGGKSTLVNTVETTSRGEIKAAFEYGTHMIDKDGKVYNTGFGLVTRNDGATGNPGDPNNPNDNEDPFNSEFYVQADKFKVVAAGANPNPATDKAIFSIDSQTGQTIIGTEFTEATKNEFKGPWDSNEVYDKGDVVTHEGSSYTSKISDNTASLGNTTYWAVAAYGARGSSTVTETFADTPTSNDLSLAFAVKTGHSDVVAGDSVVYTVTGGTNPGTYTAYYTGIDWSSNVALVVNGDAVINGTLSLEKLVTSDDPSSYVASKGFKSGEKGWAITGAGSAEFNDINIRVRASQLEGSTTKVATHRFRSVGTTTSHTPWKALPQGTISSSTAQNFGHQEYGEYYDVLKSDVRGSSDPSDMITVTNEFDQDATLALFFTGQFTSGNGAGISSTKKAANAYAGIEVFDENLTSRITKGWFHSGSTFSYHGQLITIGSVRIPAGTTYKVRLYLGGSPFKYKSGTAKTYFEKGTMLYMVSTDAQYIPFEELEFTPPSPDESFETVYRYMSSDSENGPWTETDSTDSVWLRRDYSLDYGETWTLGTPVYLKGNVGNTPDINDNGDGTIDIVGGNGTATVSNGINTATVTIYAQGTSAPSFTGSLQYTFSTSYANLSGGGAWSLDMPDADPDKNIYVRTCTVSSITNDATASSGDFSGPVLYSVTPQSAVITLYKVTDILASGPSKPNNNITYTFSTMALSGSLDGWSDDAPNVEQGQKLWSISARAYSLNETDTITPTDWGPQTVVTVSADPTAQTANIVVYRRTEDPTPPSFSNPSGTWDFEANTFNSGVVLNGWTESQPALSSGPYLWVMTGSAAATGDASQPGVITWDPSFLMDEKPWTYSANSTNHVFKANPIERVLSAEYALFNSLPVVVKGNTTYSYDGTSSYAANSFRYSGVSGGKLTGTNVVLSVASNGELSIDSISNILTADADTASITVSLIDNWKGTVFGSITYTFSKVIEAIRPSRHFKVTTTSRSSFEGWREQTVAGVDDIFYYTDARHAVSLVLAHPDNDTGTIVPNDKVTMSYEDYEPVSRVYLDQPRTNTTGVVPEHFSEQVVATFDGSVIVDGSLSASTLAADTAIVNDLSVHSTLVMGNDTNTGVIKSTGKAAYNDSVPGMYLAGDDAGAELGLYGGTGNYLEYSTSAGLTLVGTLRTSDTGQRMEINSVEDRTNFYNTSNQLAASIGAGITPAESWPTAGFFDGSKVQNNDTGSVEYGGFGVTALGAMYTGGSVNYAVPAVVAWGSSNHKVYTHEGGTSAVGLYATGDGTDNSYAAYFYGRVKVNGELKCSNVVGGGTTNEVTFPRGAIANNPDGYARASLTVDNGRYGYSGIDVTHSSDGIGVNVDSKRYSTTSGAVTVMNSSTGTGVYSTNHGTSPTYPAVMAYNNGGGASSVAVRAISEGGIGFYSRTATGRPLYLETYSSTGVDHAATILSNTASTSTEQRHALKVKNNRAGGQAILAESTGAYPTAEFHGNTNNNDGVLYVNNTGTTAGYSAIMATSGDGITTAPQAYICTGGTVPGARAFWSVRGGFHDEGGDGYGQFTGIHEGLLVKDSGAVAGDILIDDTVVARRDVSDAVCTNYLSSQPNEKGALGVLKATTPLTDYVITPSSFRDEDNVLTNGEEVVPYTDTHDVAFINSVGEGLVNVVGENGTIEKGDLIVCSSTPGKGMKQDDDIVRSYTVAKARETVTFTSSEEVKQIACIYLCG